MVLKWEMQLFCLMEVHSICRKHYQDKEKDKEEKEKKFIGRTQFETWRQTLNFL